ncbi:PfkB family carbohydrate kinase [Mucilaginibacter daejeonensis]|uniref:PfkB family carbohydrate kinase n=1 Tax=Mucilaginibacter daejeonensis TaxID=398049 RepID=UPI001D177FD9|nr:PfkB family carbohydrate kinase [Mucilaginibacter daejeonensis]UEG51395.1 PfkB family carbohydrate kinase [Mucilaginibacter daejeonensis]
MIVVGGTYDEYCFEPRWDKTFGSGLRACWALSRLRPDQKIQYHTFGNSRTGEYLTQLAEEINFQYTVYPTPHLVQFRYDYPMADPLIVPRPDTLNSQGNVMTINGEVILYYGMIEGNGVVCGNKVIYDPQSPVHPILFSVTGSTAKRLAIVVNIAEARRMTGAHNGDIQAIQDFFFEKEGAEVVVLKMGAKGALVKTINGQEQVIPVYETKNIWPIGSGDVFAASFAHHWELSDDPIMAARNASWDTAVYCNTRNFNFLSFESDPEIKPFLIEAYPDAQLYLAGPFFTFSERWLINEIYQCLRSMNIKVFSPWHHVGLGEASTVVPLDIKGLNESKVVLAVLDGLDSGTLFEIGFAVAKECTVIGYVENETSESIKMLEGTACTIEKDLTTALYKSLWALAKIDA